MAAPDPTAATDVPRERARLPPLPQQSPREWSRVRRAEDAAPEHLDLEFLPDGTEPPMRVGQVAAPAPVPVPVEVQPLEDEVTDHGTTAEAQAEVWRWNDPYLGLAPPARQLAYLAHMCELMERAERRAQALDPRDPVLGGALEEAQQHFDGGRKRDKLFHLGHAVAAKVAEKGGVNTRYLAALGSAVGGMLVGGALVAEFVLDHLDVIAALVRGL